MCSGCSNRRLLRPRDTVGGSLCDRCWMFRFCWLAALICAHAALLACAADDDDGIGDCGSLAAAADLPEVTFSAPAQQALFGAGDAIEVRGSVSDGRTAAAELTVILQDTVDVTPVDLDVEVGAPGADGTVTATVPAGTLDAGPHVLRLLATDADGCQGNDTVVVCVAQANCDF